MLKELAGDAVVESLGNEVLNKQATKKYRYTMTKPIASSNIMWVATNGDILQLDTSGTMNKKPFHTVIQYSLYNSPAIKIMSP